jgi:hypothetical protein
MKKIILLFLCAIYIDAIGQSDKDGIFYTPYSLNGFIYVGVSNPLEFVDMKYDKMGLKFFVENGQIKLISNKYYITSSISSGNIKVKAYQYLGSDSSLFCIQFFSVAKINDPVFQLNDRTIDFYKTVYCFSKNELKEPKLRALVPNCELWTDKLQFEITHFELELPKGVILSSNDSLFTSEMIDNIEQLKNNTKIVISHIEARAPDGSIRKLGGGYIMIRN